MEKKKTTTREGQNEVQPAPKCEVKNEEWRWALGEDMKGNLPEAPPSPPADLRASRAGLKWLLQTCGGVSQRISAEAERLSVETDQAATL